LRIRGKINGSAPITVGDEVDVFVRPEAIKIIQGTINPDEKDNSLQCKVVDLLFNGANSSALLEDITTGKELHVALPQTGEYIGLQKGEKLTIAWSQDQTHCFKAEFKDQA